MLSSGQEKVLKKLAEIEKQLPTGVSLTFAVDNLAETMDEQEWSDFVTSLYKLIDEEYVAKHTKKVTKNQVPFWMELTNKGREHCRRLI
jgi:hypothetical protein